MWFVSKDGAKGNALAASCWGPFDSEADAVKAAEHIAARGTVAVIGPGAVTQKVSTTAPTVTVTPVVAPAVQAAAVVAPSPAPAVTPAPAVASVAALGAKPAAKPPLLQPHMQHPAAKK
jgi:hypothetical protein